jgi:hypothetical protein
LKGFHWVTDAHYMVVPKGVSDEHLAVVLDLVAYLLTPEAQLRRPRDRPFLDFSLFGQETVDFRLHDLNACLLTGCRRLSVFNKAVDQQVLKLRDPGSLLWSLALLCADPCFLTSRGAFAVD